MKIKDIPWELESKIWLLKSETENIRCALKNAENNNEYRKEAIENTLSYISSLIITAEELRGKVKELNKNESRSII